VEASLGDMGLAHDMGVGLDGMELGDKELVHMETMPPMQCQHKQTLIRFSLPCLSHDNK